MTSQQQAANYWNATHAVDGGDGVNFLNHPMVAGYTAIRAVGIWVGHIDIVIAELRTKTRPGARILSPGCGAGNKELALARALPDRYIIGGDIATAALQTGREAAARAGLSNIEFVEQDFNDLHLDPQSLDAVAGLGALHHVEKLEHFWAECQRALRPGGVILGQEYIGADRFQWSDTQIAEANRVLRDMVPEEHKVHHRAVVRTPIEQMMALDPSEAVRSSELLPTLKASGLELAGYASAGGALLQPVLDYQIHTYNPSDWAHNLVLARLFAEEDRLMKEGILSDAFCMFVTKPWR